MILAARRLGAVHLALLEAGVLVDYAIWQPDEPDGVGDRYTGRVTARAPALGGVFVDLGAASGFLPDSAGGKSASEGDLLAVRIIRAAQGGKGPRLARAPGEPAGRPGLDARGPGPIGEFRALHPAAPILAEDFELIARLRPDFADVEHAPSCFAGIEEEIAGLTEQVVHLPGGARAIISPTPALTAIDIDAGAATAERGEKTGLQARLNRALIPELARQIRLRNLNGAILIDFAGMKASARPSLAPDLTQALARDPLKPRLLGFTSLGFAEILRPRIRPPLHEILP
ncbi:ribonuclease E/G [Acidiphilium acidophilum]|uniref:ribonuclease E/G n=1 Tax=Acidiphilium acidophilum TaxID=76588 RepID=UPI002E8E79CB|nr:ribonuclease E/G [Acidiphilium acidophilum]